MGGDTVDFDLSMNMLLADPLTPSNNSVFFHPHGNTYAFDDFSLPFSMPAMEGVFNAIYQRDILTLQMIAKTGITLNFNDGRGNPPLIVAAKLNYNDVLQCLIQCGANVNLSDKSGSTALHWSAALDNTQAVITLLNGGADRTIVNLQGKTPAEVARLNNRCVIAKYLDDQLDLSLVTSEICVQNSPYPISPIETEQMMTAVLGMKMNVDHLCDSNLIPSTPSLTMTTNVNSVGRGVLPSFDMPFSMEGGGSMDFNILEPLELLLEDMAVTTDQSEETTPPLPQLDPSPPHKPPSTKKKKNTKPVPTTTLIPLPLSLPPINGVASVISTSSEATDPISGPASCSYMGLKAEYYSHMGITPLMHYNATTSTPPHPDPMPSPPPLSHSHPPPPVNLFDSPHPSPIFNLGPHKHHRQTQRPSPISSPATNRRLLNSKMTLIRGDRKPEGGSTLTFINQNKILQSPLIPTSQGNISDPPTTLLSRSIGSPQISPMTSPIIIPRNGLKSTKKINPGKENLLNYAELRVCTLCGTNKTPQWRRGLDGAACMCNSCGLKVKHRQKRKAKLALATQDESAVEIN